MRYWQHTALLYHLDGVPVLVDATSGNIPFLFLEGAEAERMLGYDDKTSVKVRMVEAEEDYYYHRVPQDIPENLFFALEGWLSYTDMVQVFENELGLYLSDEFYVTPLPYRNGKEYAPATPGISRHLPTGQFSMRSAPGMGAGFTLGPGISHSQARK